MLAGCKSYTDERKFLWCCTLSYKYSDAIRTTQQYNKGIVHSPYATTANAPRNTKSSLLHAGGYLDLSALPVRVRHAVARTDAPAAPTILADVLGTDVLELKVPASAPHSPLCAFLPILLLPGLLLKHSPLLAVHVLQTLLAFRTREILNVPALNVDELRVGNALIGREKSGRESLCCVLTCELSRFGCGLEELDTRSGVNRQVVDALVGHRDRVVR